MTTLDIDLGPKARAFRDEVRQWLAVHRPAASEASSGAEGPPSPARGPGAGARWRAWTEALQRAGYLCVSWPTEYGGRGLSGIEVAVMNEEFARVGVPRVTRGMGEWLVGPSIIVWGTDEQKAYFLPRIIDGTDRYCQGFSEPDAGSDLAALTTRGVVDGDEIVISGQKVWTSGAQMANVMFCLCRTDPDAPKHQGISYVLVPMRRDNGTSNGFELAPIRQMNGSSGFTTTFITEARAPLFNVVAGLNNGWRVTMTTLGNERGGNATTQHVQYKRQFSDAVDMVHEQGRAQDPLVRQQLAWAYTRTEIMRFQGLRLLSEVVAKKERGPASSINKMFWSEYAQRFAEILIDLRGAQGTVMGPQRPDQYRPDRWQADFLSTRSVTIWGGTAQVQRNIVGERVLGLPKDPSPDEDRAAGVSRAVRRGNDTGGSGHGDL